MKIKSSKKYTTRFKKMAFGGEPDEEVLAVHSFYDEKGNVIEEIRIDEEDQEEKHVYEYHENGKLIRHDLMIESDGISETFNYTRDEKGRLIEETKYYGDDPGERVVYVYEAHDQPVSISRFDSDGEPESIETISYNDKNLLIEHKRAGADSKIIEVSRIEYDEKELPVNKTVLDSKNEIISVTTLGYNDKNELIRVTEKNSEGKTVSDITSTYDERGNVTSRKVRDFHSKSLQFVYDENDNCIEEAVYDEHGNLTMKSNYEFDSENHLISESEYLLDMNRGSQMANSQSRYEYEYWTS